MTDSVRDLLDRWEQVWHEGRYDLIPSCVASHYIRHDEKGDRTLTRDEYAAGLQVVNMAATDIPHSLSRAWPGRTKGVGLHVGG
jgi:hypothetical protein